jgi:hypothetical protein
VQRQPPQHSLTTAQEMLLQATPQDSSLCWWDAFNPRVPNIDTKCSSRCVCYAAPVQPWTFSVRCLSKHRRCASSNSELLEYCNQDPVVSQVGKTGTDCKADLEMPSLHDLRTAMPGLWKLPASSTHPHLVYAHPLLTEATAAAKAQGVPDIPIEVLKEYRRRAIKVAAGE